MNKLSTLSICYPVNSHNTSHQLSLPLHIHRSIHISIPKTESPNVQTVPSFCYKRHMHDVLKIFVSSWQFVNNLQIQRYIPAEKYSQYRSVTSKSQRVYAKAQKKLFSILPPSQMLTNSQKLFSLLPISFLSIIYDLKYLKS